MFRWLQHVLPATKSDVAYLRHAIHIYGDTIMALLDSIKSEVARTADLAVKIGAKIDELKANGADPAEVQALSDALKSSNDALEAKLA